MRGVLDASHFCTGNQKNNLRGLKCLKQKLRPFYLMHAQLGSMSAGGIRSIMVTVRGEIGPDHTTVPSTPRPLKGTHSYLLTGIHTNESLAALQVESTSLYMQLVPFSMVRMPWVHRHFAWHTWGSCMQSAAQPHMRSNWLTDSACAVMCGAYDSPSAPARLQALPHGYHAARSHLLFPAHMACLQSGPWHHQCRRAAASAIRRAPPER